MESGTPRGPMRHAMVMVLVAAFLDMMAMGIVMPVLPRLIEDFTGSNAAAGLWTGILGSIWAVAQLLCAPLIGSLSDRFGRRPVILISTAGLSLDWVLMALAPNLWWLVVGRIIGGITSASGTALFACMADITPPERRAGAFGMLGATVSAGFIAGPAIGGLLGEWGPRAPFWAAAAFSASAFLYGLFVLPETLPADRRSPFIWKSAHPFAPLAFFREHAGLRGLAASGFLLTFVHRLLMTVFVLFLGHRFGLGPLEIGVLLAVSSILDFVLQGLLVGPAVARFGARRLIGFGLGIAAACHLAMAFAPTVEWFVAAFILNALWALAEPTIRSALSERVADTAQGQLQGAIQSLASVAGIVGPLFFGAVYGATSGTMAGLVFVIGAGLLLLAAVCGLGSGRARAAI